MAKVKGPCMSMDARGQLGKMLVFIGWKGIKDVRSYVIPANPQTDPQMIQRGFMTAAVAAWHAFTRTAYDIAAFNIVASIQAAIMSGFNYFCKMWIAALKGEIVPFAFSNFVTTANTGGTLSWTVSGGGAVLGWQRSGSSPTVLGAPVAMAGGGGAAFSGAISGTVAGDYVYITFETTDADSVAVAGIYKVLILA